MHFKKKIVIYIVLYLFVFHTNIAVNGQCVSENTVFKSGEKVYYSAYYNWGFIWLNAGLVSFTATKTKWNDRDAFLLESIGTTRQGYDKIFMVRDTFQSFVTLDKLKPLEFYRATNEGSTKSHHHYIFKEKEKVVKARISRDGKPFESFDIDWIDCSFDVLSMIYQARNIKFENYKVGDRIPITLLVDGEIFNLSILYLGEETVSDRSGRTFACLKFQPELVAGTIFKAGNDMTVWVTKDKNRMPIIVEAKILIGSVKAILLDYEGLRYPLTSLKR